MSDQRVPHPTQRLRFRHYTESDVDFVANLFGDDLARVFYPKMSTREAQSGWIQWNLSNYREYGYGLWVIVESETNTAIGDCGLTLQGVNDGKMVEVGYHLRETSRGMGYATEAGMACVSFAFDELGVESVCSIVDPDNQASSAVALRLHDSQSTFTNTRGDTMLLFTTERGERCT